MLIRILIINYQVNGKMEFLKEKDIYFKKMEGKLNLKK